MKTINIFLNGIIIGMYGEYLYRVDSTCIPAILVVVFFLVKICINVIYELSEN